ncbi:MAG TPA: hypothetical protein VG777_09060 [Thermoanaerobaculia bacterium]|nr:hypothetical protein [Thermoanaerobaculia bacterium]
MDLIERYLQAVRLWLPGSRKQDIVAELREDLRSQVEDREAEVGRPLNDAEVEAVLKRCGRPIAVAGRYLPHPWLIGPSLFPMYRAALKGVAIFCLVPWALLSLGLVLFVPSFRDRGPGALLLGAWSNFWNIALFAFGAVTLLFAGLERLPGETGIADRWNPRNLPKVRDANRIPRAGSIVELAVIPLFIAWWTDLSRGFPVAWALARGGATWTPGPVWEDFHRRFFLPVLVLALVGVVMAAVNLAFPNWTRPRLGVRLAIDLASAGMIAVALASHRAAVGAEIAALRRHAVAGPAAAAAITDVAVFWALAIAALVCLCQAAWDAWRMARLGEGAIES